MISLFFNVWLFVMARDCGAKSAALAGVCVALAGHCCLDRAGLCFFLSMKALYLLALCDTEAIFENTSLMTTLLKRVIDVVGGGKAVRIWPQNCEGKSLPVAAAAGAGRIKVGDWLVGRSGSAGGVL